MSVENGSGYQGRLEIKALVSAASYRKQQTPASLISCERKTLEHRGGRCWAMAEAGCGEINTERGCEGG